MRQYLEIGIGDTSKVTINDYNRKLHVLSIGEPNRSIWLIDRPIDDLERP